MTSSNKTAVFLLGTGYIGGSILTALLDEGRYAVTALSRSDDKAKVLQGLGVNTVKGSLDDEDVIVKAVLEHEVSWRLLLDAAKRELTSACLMQIIIHAATADDAPSVKAILKGLAQRSPSAPPATYIHTSGVSCLPFALVILPISLTMRSVCRPESSLLGLIERQSCTATSSPRSSTRSQRRPGIARLTSSSRTPSRARR